MRLATTLPLAVFARAPAVAEASSDASLRYPRLLYYGGLLTIGHLAFRPGLSLTLSEYFFLAALLLALPMVVGRGVSSVGYRPAGILFGTALFGLGALLSTVGSPQPIHSIGVVARFCFMTLVWLWLGTVLLPQPHHVRVAAGCWVLSLAVSGSVAVAQLLSGDGLVLPDWVVMNGRMTGLAEHVNDLGASSAVAVAAALWLVLRAPNAVTRLGTLVLLVLVEAGLMLSGSMSGLLAAAVGVALLMALLRPSARLIALTVFAVVAAFGLTQLQAANHAPTPQESIGRVSGTEANVERGTLWVRLDSYRAALSRVAQNPVIGVGPEAGGAKTGTGTAVYNVFLSTWHESGGLAALGLVLVMGSCAVAAVGALKQAGVGEERLLVVALVACFAAYLAFAMGAPVLYPRYGWVPVALILALRAQQLELKPKGAVSSARVWDPRGPSVLSPDTRSPGIQSISAARMRRGGSSTPAECVADSRRRS